MDAIKNAYTAATRITDFWSAQVGRALNPLEDFSMLVEWSDAIDAGIAAALSVRSWLDLRDLDAMRDECDMWLDHWHTYNQ